MCSKESENRSLTRADRKRGHVFAGAYRLDEGIDVALFVVVSAHDGTENAHVPGAHWNHGKRNTRRILKQCP
jgi:hypothetical protein